MDIRKDAVLDRMLRDRKAPLSEASMRQLLADLTLHIAGNVIFAAAVYPKREMLSKIDIHAKDIEKADIMEGTDGQKYFPVFTDIDRLKKWKPKFNPGEYIYLMDKQDILNFLNANPKVAAAVANPGEDDLLLHRMQLQNMIQIGSSGGAL
jgi:hypothetical protein